MHDIVWIHMTSLTLSDITPRCDIHKHSINVITPSIPVIASTVAELLLTVYWLYHICNMCVIKHTTCMTSYELYGTSQPIFISSQDCTHDITSTQFMTSHPLYMTWYTLCLWHHSHCNYEKIPTIFLTIYSGYMTSHMLNEWQHNDCSDMMLNLSLQWNPLDSSGYRVIINIFLNSIYMC